MGTIGSSADDYKKTMIALAPKGDCWPTEEDANWVKLWEALAQEYARVDARAVDLYNEAFPDTADELLANWERIVGLPDAFSNPDATLEERRADVLFKLRARGGQSAEYYEDLIDALGYENVVEECFPWAADIGEAGWYLFDEAWLHHFLVIVQGPVADEALFEARFKTVIPAQAIPVFIYE